MTDGPKLHRRHGFYVLVMVIGWVLPPIAVLLRFGFGTDFLLNTLLTLCGYIPGHGHNFYLQNIRNNHNRKRTPAWATRAGLVKDQTTKRKAKTQWANRYDERTPTRADGYQDEDDKLSNNIDSTQPTQGTRIEQPLLEPESFIESSSSLSIDSHRDHHQQRSPSSTRTGLSSSKHSNKNKNTYPSFTNSSHSSVHTGYLTPGPYHSKTSSRTTFKDSKHSQPGERRMTFDPLTPANDTHNNSNGHHEDPYFIRRASTIHVPSSSYQNRNKDKKSVIHSPTSVKSFPSKLGFSSKSKSSNQKDREEEMSREENQARRSPSYSPTPQTNPHTTNINHEDDDGLNHQF